MSLTKEYDIALHNLYHKQSVDGEQGITRESSPSVSSRELPVAAMSAQSFKVESSFQSLPTKSVEPTKSSMPTSSNSSNSWQADFNTTFQEASIPKSQSSPNLAARTSTIPTMKEKKAVVLYSYKAEESNELELVEGNK